jgi:RNA polymerase sigma-70 factor (ECF subfamily)
MHRSITREREIGSVMIKVATMLQKLSEGAGDAEDVAQEVMIKLLKVSAFEKEIKSGWLYKVARNCLVDCRRKMAMERHLFNHALFVDITGAVRVSSEDEPIYVPVVRESGFQWEPDFRALVEKSVSELSEPQKITLLLYAEGYSYDEIASAMGVNIGTVRSRLNFARKRIKSEVGDAA